MWTASGVKLDTVPEMPLWVEVKPGGPGSQRELPGRCFFYAAEGTDRNYYINYNDNNADKIITELCLATAKNAKINITYSTEDDVSNETIARSKRVNADPLSAMVIKKHRKVTDAKIQS
jgi:hypothetical protein